MPEVTAQTAYMIGALSMILAVFFYFLIEAISKVWHRLGDILIELQKANSLHKQVDGEWWPQDKEKKNA